MNEPTRSWNAVFDPNEMAPRPEHNIAEIIVAGTGHDNVSLTRPSVFGNGTALSRASDQRMREMVRKVPTTQIRTERKTIRRRPKVPPLLPVAWAYTSARGKEPE